MIPSGATSLRKIEGNLRLLIMSALIAEACMEAVLLLMEDKADLSAQLECVWSVPCL